MDYFPSASGNSFSIEWLDIFIVLGAVLLVSAVVFTWAMLRNPKSRRRKRRRHRENRRQGITLAETGGLPPIRGGTNSKSPPPSVQP